MIVLPRWPEFNVPDWKAHRIPRGTWHFFPIADPDYTVRHGIRVVGAARGIVHVNCPNCDKLLMLCGTIHQIGPDGSVSPSIVCPYPPCGWHVFAKLAGWPP